MAVTFGTSFRSLTGASGGAESYDYFMRADGTAANLAAATGPITDASACMNMTVHNAATIAAGSRILVSDRGGHFRAQFTPPSSGSSGSPILYQGETGHQPVMSGANLATTWSSAVAGNETVDSQETHSFNFFNSGRDTQNFWRTVRWTASESFSCTGLGLWIAQVGTLAGGSTLTVEIWDDSGGDPNAVIANGTSASVDATAISTSGELVEFTFSTSPSLTVGNDYYVVLKHSWTTDSTNYVQWRGTDQAVDAAFVGGRIQQNSTYEEFAFDGGHLEIYKESTATVWEATVSAEPRVVLMDGVYGERKSSIASCTEEYDWHWASNTLTINAPTDPDTRYTAPGVEVGARNRTAVIDAKTHLTFNNIKFSVSTEYGTFFSGDGTCNNHTFINCDFHGAFEFNVVTSFTNQIDDVTFRDCRSSYAGASGWKLNGAMDNWHLLRCYSDRDGCIDQTWDNGSTENFWGGGINAVNDSVTVDQTNMVVEYCVVTNAGKKRDGSAVSANGKGFSFWSDIVHPDSPANGSIWRYNIAINGTRSGFFCEKTTDSQWYYNISIDNDEYGLRVETDVDTADKSVEDNTFYNFTLHGNDTNLYCQGVGTTGVFTGNAFRNILMSGGVTREMFMNVGADNDGTNGSGNTYEYLLAPESANFISWDGTDYSTIAAWEAAVTGAANNIAGSAAFVDDTGDAAADYKITASSDAIGAGVDVSLSQDYYGNTVGATPDIGAHDYTGENA